MKPSLAKAILISATLATTGLMTTWSIKAHPPQSSPTEAYRGGSKFTVTDESDTEAAANIVLSTEVVASHNTSSDCWTIIHDQIYDITSYVPYHPGGTDTIIEACGTDSTTAFDTKGGRGRPHLASTQDILAQYRIGGLGESLNTSEPVPTPLPPTPTPPLPTVIVPTLPAGTSQGTGTSGGSSTSQSLTATVVSLHASAGDCWIIVSGGVYNVSQYIPYHPGGTAQITQYCGKDATTGFNNRGGTGSHSSSAQSLLANYRIGTLGQDSIPSNTTTSGGSTSGGSSTSGGTGSSPAPTSGSTGSGGTSGGGSSSGGTSTTLDAGTIAQHNSQSSCWLIINNKVYDVTNYIPFHPGGTSRITNYCGGEATNAFNTRGGSGSHSNNANNQLASYYIGEVGGTSTGSTSGGTTSGGGSTSGGSGSSGGGSSTTYNTPEAAVLAAYPGATITKVEHEDDGRSTVKFQWNGQSYEAKLNAQNVITKVDD